MTGTQGTPTGTPSGCWERQSSTVLEFLDMPRMQGSVAFYPSPHFLGFCWQKVTMTVRQRLFQDKKQARLWFAVRLADSLNFIVHLSAPSQTHCVCDIHPGPPRHPYSNFLRGTGGYTLTLGTPGSH